MIGMLIKWLVLIAGGLVGNMIASVFLIRGEFEGDNRGFVQVDNTTWYGPDDIVRVLSILGGAKAASKLYSAIRGGGK